MCGICGLIEPYNSPDNKLIQSMTDVLNHRGPDDKNIFIKNNIGVGHTRLSIIDVTHGQQPLLSDDKQKVLVFNGEIYNYIELKQQLIKKGYTFKTDCDTEVLLKMYENYGYDCLQYLRGMFSFSIYDFTTKTLFAARDRLGQKPFYYSLINNRLYFASEIKSILQDSRVERIPELKAIDSYLSFKYVPHPLTAFKNIFKLPHGHFLIYKNNTIEIKKYWKNWYKKNKINDINEIKYNVTELLKESVNLRLRSDVPLGAFLSGGIDSSIIVGLMSELSPNRIKTFSIGFEEKRFDERQYAKQVADRYNTEHYEFLVKPDSINDIEKLVWHYNEPYADCSMLPTYYLSRETRKYVKVALSGDAGDENFAGYLRYLGFMLTKKFDFIPETLRTLLFKTLYKILPSAKQQKNMYNKINRFLNIMSKKDIEKYLPMIEDFSFEHKNKIYTDKFKTVWETHNSENFIKQYFNELPELNDLDRLLYTDLNTYLPDDLMVKTDIASMAVSLECRAPFLDHKFVEYVSGIPSELKLKNKTTKFILKECFKDYIPHNLVNRPKAGFAIPVSEWFRTDLKSYIKNILSDKFFERGLFDKKQTLNMLNEHLTKQNEHGYKLWNLMCLELWFRKFFD